MVAPEGEAKRRVKLRDHCATCGKRYPEPRRWAYCSKKCERERKGFDDMPTVADADAYLTLANQLETAMPAERAEIRKKMRALERPVIAIARSTLRELGAEHRRKEHRRDDDA